MLSSSLINFLIAMMLVMEYFLNHTSCIYLGTVELWLIDRDILFTCTVILFTALVMFSTRSELLNRANLEQLSNNITLMRYNSISLVRFCLKKTSSILFSKLWLTINPLFCVTTVVWCASWNQPDTSNCKCDFSS